MRAAGPRSKTLVRTTPRLLVTLGAAGAVGIVLLVLVSSLAVGSVSARVANVPVGSEAPGSAPSSTVRALPPPTTNVSVPFFTNDLSVGNVSPADVYSGTYGAYPMPASPTLLLLANDHVGIGFSVVSTNTTSTCPGASGNSFSRIAWADSSDNGSTFGPLRYIGNTGSDGCPYFEGLEPSFAEGSDGTIYGAYVETNASINTLSYYAGAGPRPIANFADRSYDALAFLSSTDDGTSFSATQTLVTGGNISDPAVAAFGKTVYVVYENVTNSTNTSSSIPRAGYGSTSTPGAVALHLVYSNDEGATWHGPYAIPAGLPGADPAELYDAVGVSVAVGPTGSVAVAFAANRTCVAWCSGFPTYGDDIVARFSSTNGTSWGAARVVARNAAEFPQTYDFVGPGIWQNIVQTAVKFGSSSSDVYVAWSQAVNISLTDIYATQLDWQSSGIRAAASTNGGTSWTTSAPSPDPPSLDYNQQVFGQGYYNPGLGVAPDGTVYVTFSSYNWTNYGYGYSAWQQNVFPIGNIQWLTSSPDGIAWGSPTVVVYLTQSYPVNYLQYWGYTSSVAFDAAGSPLVAYSLMAGFFAYIPWLSTTGMPVDLGVGSRSTAPAVVLTLRESGLAPGTPWEAAVDGYVINTTAPAVNVTDLPSGLPVWVYWPGSPTPTGYRTEAAVSLSDGPNVAFVSATTIWFNFSTFYGISFNFLPANQPYVALTIANYGANTYRFSWDMQNYWGGSSLYYYQYATPDFPWYFPSGTSVPLAGGSIYFQTGTFVGYWSGQGAGSYTGTDPTPTLTVDSAFNETGWMIATGTYDLGFSAPHLPSTSNFTVTIDGQTISAAGGATAIAHNLSSGAYALSGLGATSAAPGREYFGYSEEGNPIVVPDVPAVNLSFAYVDLSSASGMSSYRAQGLPAGTPWQLAFNGTVYSSTTPWINVSSRTGTYPVAAYPTVSPDGASSFAPSGIGSGGSVVPGSTYDVNFTAAFQLQLLAAQGGKITPGAGVYWLAPGGSENLSATPNAGYAFLGWTGTGTGSYTGPIENVTVIAGAALTEAAAFGPLVPNRFNATLTESGLPSGTPWTVRFGTTGYTTSNATLTVGDVYSCSYSGSLGRYAVSLPYVYPNATPGIRYVPNPPSATVCGGGAATAITFSQEVEVTLGSSVGGLAESLAAGSVGSFWVATGATATLNEVADPGYDFVGWIGTGPGSYSGSLAAPSFSPSGPVTEVASFTVHIPPPPTTYTLTLVSAPAIANGTLWTVTVNGMAASSTTGTVVVPGLAAGSYVVNVSTVVGADGASEWVPASTSFHVTVPTSGPITVGFTLEYWVEVTATGPGTAGPVSGFQPYGKKLALTATPTGLAEFVGWSGTGSGSFTGTTADANVTVAGAIAEVATFAAAPPAAASGGSSDLLGSPLVWGALGLVGLVVGAGIGFLLARRRGPEASAPAEGGRP